MSVNPSLQLRRALWALAVVGLGTVAAPRPVPAQPPTDPGVRYTRLTNFPIPFTVDSSNPQLRQVELYVSLDNGRTWDRSDAVAPQQQRFLFRATRDGTYTFAIRAVYDTFARPADVSQLQPAFTVVIDSQTPNIMMRQLPSKRVEASAQYPRGGVSVGVEWDIRDDYLDPASVMLEGRWAGTGRPFASMDRDGQGPIGLRGERRWTVEPGQSLELQLRAKDLAGNQGMQSIVLNSTGFGPAAPGASAPGGPMASPAPGGPTDNRVYVNKQQVKLDFKVENLGPSGLSNLDLWYTAYNNRVPAEWKKSSPTDTQRQGDNTLIWNAPGEGVFGLTMVARSLAGLGDREPMRGDEPRVLVEVDTTPPDVKLIDVVVAPGQEVANVTITWRAGDKNLLPQSVIIEYGSAPNANDWRTIAANLDVGRDGTGRYSWEVPRETPHKFFVRVRATDRAGNQGQDVAQKETLVDLKRPTVNIINVGPGGSTSERMQLPKP